MRQGELIRVFKAKNVVDPEDYPRGLPLRLLTRIGTLYERLGLVSADEASSRCGDAALTAQLVGRVP